MHGMREVAVFHVPNILSRSHFEIEKLFYGSCIGLGQILFQFQLFVTYCGFENLYLSISCVKKYEQTRKS